MTRLCTEVDTFIENNGVDSFRKTFQPESSIEELLLDPVIYRSNVFYEKTFGPGITEDHIAEFIESWGVVQYMEWCARNKSYDSIVSNARFASAQEKYLEKNIDIEPGFRSTAIKLPVYNPFHRKFHDDKGVAVPEPPPNPHLDDFYDQDYSLYIQDNGIINYMLKINSINTLDHLLNYKDVAAWQRSYIRNLEYDERLI